MPNQDANLTAGVEPAGWRAGGTTGDSWYQYVVPVRDRLVSYQGRASTFRTPSRNATTQNLLTIYNASATSTVAVNRLVFDMYSLVGAAATVHPAIVRISRFTTNPTTGTVLAETSIDTTQTADTAVTLRGDASADGTASGTALAVTIPAGGVLTQEVCPRIVGTTNNFIEIADRMEFFVGQPDIILRQNQGLVLHTVWAAAPAAGTATVGHHFVASIDYEEYTRP